MYITLVGNCALLDSKTPHTCYLAYENSKKQQSHKMAYVLADDILEQSPFVDRPTDDTSILALLSPMSIDVELDNPEITITPETPRNVETLATITPEPTLLKPEEPDINDLKVGLIPSRISIESLLNDSDDTDEDAEYLPEPHIDEDEDEYSCGPSDIKDDADEPEDYFREPYIEDEIEEVLQSVSGWLGKERIPVIHTLGENDIHTSGLRPISLLNEPFQPRNEAVDSEPCKLGKLLGLITPIGCLGCGGKHSMDGVELPVFEFAPKVKLPSVNPFATS